MAKFIPLTTAETLDELFEASNQNPVILFKHSTTCPISSSVYQEVSNIESDIHLVIVQSSRDISKLIAERTNVMHESPQALVLKNGEAVYHASHFDITAEDLNEAIE